MKLATLFLLFLSCVNAADNQTNILTYICNLPQSEEADYPAGSISGLKLNLEQAEGVHLVLKPISKSAQTLTIQSVGLSDAQKQLYEYTVEDDCLLITQKKHPETVSLQDLDPNMIRFLRLMGGSLPKKSPYAPVPLPIFGEFRSSNGGTISFSSNDNKCAMKGLNVSNGAIRSGVVASGSLLYKDQTYYAGTEFSDGQVSVLPCLEISIPRYLPTTITDARYTSYETQKEHRFKNLIIVPIEN